MSKFLKVEEVKRPLKKGEEYLVPCIIKEEFGVMYITPVINHPHSDKENGQHEAHYHTDYRFVKHNGDKYVPIPIRKHSKHYFAPLSRPQKDIDGTLEYFVLPVINEEFAGITGVNLIRNSKLKHKCIHKGKCPHRGYDLSQVKPINGKITCPLHGLEFDEKSGKILNAKQ